MKSHAILDAHIGRRLFEARTAIGLSTYHASLLLGITADELEHIEAGRRATADQLYTACYCYNVSISFLFEGYVKPPN